MELFDITIVGAGPTGLFATFYAGLRGMKTKLIDALPHMGGQLAVLYPEKYIYDVPGYTEILAKDLVKILTAQAYRFNPTVCLGERVEDIKLQDRLIKLTTTKQEHITKTLLICAGVGAFSPNRLEAPGVKEFEGKGVYYFVQEKDAFNGKRLLIVGGGDSAVDWALTLKSIAQKITMIHRRDVFRAHEMSVKELFSSDVEVKLFYELKEVRGSESVTEAVIFNNKTKEETTMPVDSVLINIGFKAELGPIGNWGLEIDGRSIRVDGMMRTNLPGVYAAGDIVAPQGSVKLNLIATGYAQATVAVNCAKQFIDPKASVFPGHSSEMKL